MYPKYTRTTTSQKKAGDPIKMGKGLEQFAVGGRGVVRPPCQKKPHIIWLREVQMKTVTPARNAGTRRPAARLARRAAAGPTPRHWLEPRHASETRTATPGRTPGRESAHERPRAGTVPAVHTGRSPGHSRPLTGTEPRRGSTTSHTLEATPDAGSTRCDPRCGRGRPTCWREPA